MKRSRIPSLALLAAIAALPACQSTGDGAQQSASPDPEAAMAMMMELAQPGEHHRMLDPMVGDFRAEVTMWMAPDAPPETSTGKLSNRWIFGGRFLQGEYEGDFGGMPFEGMSIMGYDNGEQEFVGFWIDTFGTMMIPIARGRASNGGKTITMRRTMPDMMRGIDVEAREVLTIQSDDQHTYEMYSKAPGEDEVLGLRIVYTRI